MLILLLVAIALWAAGFLLLPGLIRRPSQGKSGNAGSLSIIIPARNEAHNLPRLLQSIANQDGAPAEVIVVDDGSTDQTAAVALEHGAKVLPSLALPDGWRGKTWACHQGANAAAGDLLLFLDADTWLEPGGLAKILADYGGGAFSAGPWHAVGSLMEDMSLFFNLNMTAGTVPGGLFGQMLLVDRKSYDGSGGHREVKGRVLENVFLASRFAEESIAVRSVPGRGLLSFRMYPGGPGEVIKGWTKGFSSGAGKTPRARLLLLIAWMTGLMLPLTGLALGGEWWHWTLLHLLCAAQVYGFGRLVGAFRVLTALCYPVPLIFFFVIFASSALRPGRQVTWKGRVLHAD